MKRRIAVILGLLALAGCLGPSGSGPNGASRQSDTAEQFSRMVQALEAGDTAGIENALDRRMPGYQKFVEELRTEASRVHKVRVTLKEATWRMNAESAVMAARFEKRFVGAADAVPGLFEGRMTLLMRQEGGRWIVTGVSGDNLFGLPPALP